MVAARNPYTDILSQTRPPTMLTENQPLPSPSAIGFVGLGSMGSRMARNLARKLPRGQRLVVFDVSQSAVDSFLARTCGGGDGTEKISVTVAESAGSLAVQADLVFSALPGPAESRPVYEEMANAIRGTGKGGVGKVFVECGTVRGPEFRDFMDED
jgi:3-hydroxyisobutyrate dehydrogenase-like beta-hydroxyacid dehydrogenase